MSMMKMCYVISQNYLRVVIYRDVTSYYSQNEKDQHSKRAMALDLHASIFRLSISMIVMSEILGSVAYNNKVLLAE